MDDTRQELLRSWLTKAASDLRSARVLGSVDDAPLDTAIYHCQQTAEKAVKAFLVSQAISPEKPHDIRKLTRAAAAHEPRFNEVLDRAVSLTPQSLFEKSDWVDWVRWRRRENEWWELDNGLRAGRPNSAAALSGDKNRCL